MKQLIVKLLEKQLILKKEEIESLIEIPPNSEMGDYAFPCFSLAKIEKKNPVEIAKNLTEKLNKSLPVEIDKIETKGAYVNFFLSKDILIQKILGEILKKKEKYGRNDQKKDRIMVEFPSPNTNKPLHLGHLRNMSIGESVCRILESQGNKVIRASINNDRGVHICKSMLAYMEYGKNDSPIKQKKKSDHFVGDYYVLFSKKAKENPELEKQAQDILVKWELGDKKIIEVWKKMNKWALDGFKETYKTFNIKHDKEYFESKIYTKGKEIIQQGLQKGIFKSREDKAVIIDLKEEGLDEKVLLRPDGTSVYITQDLYLAKLKDQEYNLNGSIYVVGNEQEYHFKVLFSILKKLGYKFSDNLKHLSYGMVELPEGRMKSREGTVVDADDLIEDTRKLAEAELLKREKISKKELNERSLKIALAAIKYKLLKVDISKNMIFNPKEAIAFEGDTGPYLLYSYARAKSILRKINPKSNKNIKENKSTKKLNDSEIALAKKLSEFPSTIESSFISLDPSKIAHYAFELSQLFNEFYHSSPVIGSENEKLRKDLVESFTYVLKNSLNLLGISEINEM